MRNISDASLAVLQQETGLEPVLIVKVWWGGTTATKYCDRKFEQEDLVGKLLEISGIEDVVDINAAASSVSLTVTLDDSEGDIKTIYDKKDIHKLRVQVLQWFSSLPLSEAFVIFEGEISSPILWSEGSRSLKFDVVSKLEDIEVGFSAEEGKFQFIPASIIGKAWPLVFGRVAGVKALPLTEAPSAVLAKGFSIVNDDVWQAELDDLNTAMNTAYQNAQDAYQLGLNNAFLAGAYKQFGSLPDDPDLALQYDNAAQQYYAQANQYGAEYFRLQDEYLAKTAERDLQKAYEFRSLPIAQSNLPVGNITVEIGNYTANASVLGQQITLSNLTEKVDVNQKAGTNTYAFGDSTNEYTKDSSKKQKFVWIDGGTQIKVFNFPRYYIASLGHVTVLNVWASNKNGKAVVPPGWYSVDHATYTVPGAQHGHLQATRIIFATPLTSRPGEWQDGDIEIDCVSAVGPNVVDIMRWVIARFCSLSVDNASFNHVRALVDAYPANFALSERMDVVRFLQDVAYQSRCAIWINDRKFYLRYLPEKLDPVDTITDADVEVNSLVLTSTETERVVTKYTATWKERENQDEPNKIIYRNNIKKYGVHEEEYDFYIYNNQALVAKSAEFWMIRKSNTWKILQFKALLHKLRLEAFDPVEINFTEHIASTNPVTGIVQKATYNPDDDTISMEVWLPVRLGEMKEYIYAHPMARPQIYPPQGQNKDPNIDTGNPFDGAQGTIAPASSFPPYQQITYSTFDPFTHGRGVPIGDDGDEAPGSLVTALTPSNVDQARPLNIEKFNTETKRTVNPITNPTFKQLVPGTWFGFVVSKESDNLYNVRVYFSGFSGETTTVPVKIGYIRSGATLPPDYPLSVQRAVWFDTLSGQQKFEYWAQPPIWVPIEES